jgi:hypothetical protein
VQAARELAASQDIGSLALSTSEGVSEKHEIAHNQ